MSLIPLFLPAGVTVTLSLGFHESLAPIVGFPALALGLAGIGGFFVQRAHRLRPQTLRDALMSGAREMRRRQLDLKPLSHDKRTNYLLRWNEIGKRMRSEPPKAIDEASVLLEQIFSELGYPPADQAIREEDLAGDHAQTALHFRAAAAIASKAKRGTATIAELYAAFESYRRVMLRLLQSQKTAYPL